MPGLTTQQKTAVAQFVSFTSVDKKTAEKVLKTHSWDVQRAVDGFFTHGASSSPVSNSSSIASSSALNKLFDKYRDSPHTPDTLSIDGTMNYLTDLSLSLDSITVLLLCELVQSPTLGEITRQGFTTGWAAHGSSATSVSGQKTILSRLTQQLSTAEARSANGLFKKVYKHTFKIALPAGTRGVPLDVACEYWKILFGSSGANWTESGSELTKPWLDWYLSFLNDKWKKAVNRDLWDQTLVFEEKTRSGEGLEWWSEDGAWPGVIDEFVAWCKSEKGVGAGNADVMEED